MLKQVNIFRINRPRALFLRERRENGVCVRERDIYMKFNKTLYCDHVYTHLKDYWERHTNTVFDPLSH